MFRKPTKRERRSYLPEIQEELRLREELKLTALPTAAYCRLSSEDTEEYSIETQIQICHDYIERNPELRLIDTYVDNGFTGTSFDRPEWKRLMKDAQEGRIRCIVVKDLSRFGRDYIEAGTYIEEIFPKLNLRFIAINDNTDSVNADDRTDFLTPIKNVFNTCYAKETGAKIRRTAQAKRENGIPMGKAPYGYIMEKRDLIVNQAEAEIVEMVFLWASMGATITDITSRLNLIGEEKTGKEWSINAVSYMLRNEIYTGDLVSGKIIKIMHRNRYIDKEDWVVHEDHHDAIIDREIFDTVQEILEGNGRKPRTGNKPLQEKLVCATCGRKLKWDKRQKTYYCGNHTGERASGKRMKARPESEERMIKRTLVRQAGMYVRIVLDSAEEINGLDKRGGVLHEIEQHAILVLKEKKAIEAKGQRMLDDFRKDIIDQETFMSLREDYKQELKEKDTELQSILSDHRQKFKLMQDAREILKEVRKIGQMNFETALDLAERIELRPSGLVSIEFRGQKLIEGLLGA